MFCWRCGAKNANDALFCEECGAPFDAARVGPQNPQQREIKPEQQSPATPQYLPAGVDQRTQTLTRPSYPMSTQGQPTVRPPKKRPVRRTVIIVCICIVVALGGIGLAMKAFFSRDLLQTVYGGEKYAKMSEKTAAKVVGDNTLSYLSGLSKTTAVQKANQAYVQQQKVSMSLDKNFKSYLNNVGYENTSSLDQIINYANSLTFQNTYNYNGGLTQMELALSDGNGKLLSATGYLDNNHNGYYQLPEISNTYFMTKDIALDLNTGSTLRNFSFDQKQMSESIAKLTQIWDDAIDAGQTSIEKNSELTVEGVSVNAEKVTVVLSGDQLVDLSKKLIEAIRDDKYLYTFLSENEQSLVGSGQTTLFSYLSKVYGLPVGSEQTGLDKNAYKDFLNQLEDSAKNIPDTVQEISLSLYITPQNTSVGQSCEISLKNNDSGKSKVSLNYATDNSGKISSKALSLSVDGDEYFYATQKADSSQSGDIVLAVQDPSSKQGVGLKIAYSDFKKDQFMGMPVYLGKYTVSLQDPHNTVKNYLLDNVYDSDTQGLIKNLTDSSVTVTNSLAGEKLSTSVDLSLSGLGDLKVNQTTEVKSSEKIKLPDVQANQTISIAQDGIGSGEYDKLTQYEKSSLTYLSKLMKSHSDLSDILSQTGLTQDYIDQELQYY